MHRALEEYKASTSFTTEKAQVVVAFWESKKFYDDHIKFSEEAFWKGHKLSRKNFHL